jgi:hypothetical protein
MMTLVSLVSLIIGAVFGFCICVHLFQEGYLWVEEVEDDDADY